MKVELAELSQVEKIMKIFDEGRDYMRSCGNMVQWINGYPSRELILDDISKKQLFVVKDGDSLCGVFAFIIGKDPTYGYIENGKWLNDDEYGTIHRIAGKKGSRGVLGAAIDFCKQQIPNIRIDTHADNKKMQQLMEKHGFSYCGIIYISDGSPRLAFQKCF